MRRLVVDLASDRAVWSAPTDAVEQLRRELPTDWELRHVTSLTSSDGDGSGVSAEGTTAAVGAEVYVGWGAPAEVIRAAGDALRWVHTAAGGVGGSVTDALRQSGAVLTNSRGIHGEPIADWVVTAIGFCERGFHVAAAGQRERRWAKGDLTSGLPALREFENLRVGLVGLGGIGSAVARRCAALGMEVSGVRRRTSLPSPNGVGWVGGTSDLTAMASRSDVLVIAAPHTTDTTHLIDERVLDALPSDAFLLNVSRGALLDEEALLRSLTSGQLAGCVLDVFSTEPLPSHHPFWTHPKVFVTPHVSAVTRRFWERETRLILENLRRYLAGHPLENRVDCDAGY